MRAAPERLGRTALRNGTHLAVLSALALAQPVLDVLGRNPAFFAVRGSTAGEIVLFAVALTLAPAVLLVLAELAVAAVSRTAARVVHLLFVGGFVALLALYVLAKSGALSGAAAVVIALAVGAAGAAAYGGLRPARAFVSVLAPAPLVFLGLFLLQSPVSKLVFVDAPAVEEGRAARPAASPAARTPVVLIVFDEFGTIGLMDRRGGIDARRFPNFASLAGDSTWFRGATSTYWLSEVAVPSLLAGVQPVPGRLPVQSEYPQNLFTLLGRTHRVRAIETLTRLCPPSLCAETQSEETQAVTGSFGPLASDVGIVYLHLLLPEPYAGRLPPIDDAWGHFGRQEDGDEPVRLTEGGEIEPCGRNACAFRDLISAADEPTLYFLHSLLPHVPYVYLPSGRRYAVDARLLRGVRNGLWLEEWPALQAQQRYLLQLGYTDRALGLVLERLRETGVYDRALVIVTADHGVGFKLGDQRRLPTAGNLEEIAFVPLFVKLPGQTEGEVDDSLASTVDILPTIARVLGVEVPWEMDGRPLVGRRLPLDGTVTVFRQDGTSVSATLSELVARRAETLARKVDALGEGSFDAVYRVGPHRDLVGRAVAELPVRSGGGTVEVDGRSLLDAVDPASGFLPSFVEGRLRDTPAGVQDLAIGVNGTIAAVTRTFTQNEQTRFSAFVPESALRPGRNAVDVFVVREDGGTVALEQLRGSDHTLTLRGQAIVSSVGRTIPIGSALSGSVRVTARGSEWLFAGTAAQAGTDRPVDSIAVFAGARAVFLGRAGNLKPHGILGQPDLGRTGFVFELPRSLLPQPGSGERVRVFALRQSAASELAYEEGSPWQR